MSGMRGTTLQSNNFLTLLLMWRRVSQGIPLIEKILIPSLSDRYGIPVLSALHSQGFGRKKLYDRWGDVRQSGRLWSVPTPDGEHRRLCQRKFNAKASLKMDVNWKYRKEEFRHKVRHLVIWCARMGSDDAWNHPIPWDREPQSSDPFEGRPSSATSGLLSETYLRYSYEVLEYRPS